MKYFVISDIHGFYKEMQIALKEAGFDKDNPEHCLICCGDYLDRGPDPRAVIDYVLSLKNKVLIKGNHETLIRDCINRSEYFFHDIRNGTYQTVIDLAGVQKTAPFHTACTIADPIFSRLEKELVNYYETENYIFVHSWIPVISNLHSMPWHTHFDEELNPFSFNADWRDAHQKEWDNAMWGNPFDMVKRELLPKKTVVFGHWHCSTGWAKIENRSEFDEDAKFDPFYGDGFIAIDACTAHTGKCNVIVIED